MDLTAITTKVAELAASEAAPAAADAAATGAVWPIGAGIAMGLAVLGAGIGIGKLAASALDGAARQPEMAGKLQGIMILAIAFIEALALIALLFATFLIKG